MNSRKVLLVTALVTLALANEAAAFSISFGQGRERVASIFSWWWKKPVTVMENKETNAQLLADIEQELGLAQRLGGMSLEKYQSIDSKFNVLEQKKINTKVARTLLEKIAVGDQSIKTTSAQSTSAGQTLADVEREIQGMLKFKGVNPSVYGELESKLKAFEAKGTNTKNARALLNKLPVGGQDPLPKKSSASGPIVDEARVASEPVVWEYDREKNRWVPSRTPPACPELVFDSPVDLTKASAILYPGQQRGKSMKDYKAHGGIMFASGGDVEMRMPFDGYIYQGARFLQNGVLQYGFDAIHECGIMQRFGHLYELSPKFQKLVELLPEAKEMDSRTTVLRPFVFVKKGELIATKIGVPGNIGADWGVMDLRKENEASRDSAFREAHKFQSWYDNHGLCWLDLLSPSEQRLAKALPGGDGVMGKTSDYCKSTISNTSASSLISE